MLVPASCEPGRVVVSRGLLHSQPLAVNLAQVTANRCASVFSTAYISWSLGGTLK